MKVRQLIEFLSTQDPEATIVVEGSDHSYYTVRPQAAFAEDVDGDLHEFYEKCRNPDGIKVPVVVLS